jgi:hypothetical protein
MPADFFPEGTTPLASDTPARSLKKINALLAATPVVEGAKLVEVTGSVARLALTASQVNVGDLVKEVGQLGTIVVAGAGTAVVNGTYIEDGTEGGYKKFVKAGGLKITKPEAETPWVIEDDANVYYYDVYAEDSQSPADVVSWDVDAGDSPAPTVTQGIASIAAGGTYVVLDVAELDNAAGWEALFTASNFADTNLSTLPASDPGSGKPWLNGGVLQVGP